MADQVCALCSKPLVGGGEFCAFCGAKTVPSSTTSAIDTYIQNKVKLELSDRLKDQNTLVREIGDKAEDVVWKRLQRYSVIFGSLLACILAFIAFVGIKSIDDVSTSAKKQIEPVVKEAEQRAQGAKQTIAEAATKVNSVKASVDQLSRDVDAQTKRVADKGGEISQKLGTLDVAASDAQKALENRLKGLDVRVQEVSKQVDNLSVRQVYPTLGQQKFVTFQSGRWKGQAGKEPKDKWVNIVIDPMVVGDFSQAQVEQLVTELKKAGYTPLLGSFGVGGPYASGFGSLGNINETSTLYFKKASEQMASEVSSIASKTLSLKGLKPVFVDVSTTFPLNDPRRFVVENSGLDVQLVLLRTQ